jgi:hypothetical protein
MAEIFHYCNMSKFEDILESKTIWLTPVQTMKDRTEVDHLYNYIWPKVNEKIIGETQDSSIDFTNEIFKYLDNNSIVHSSQMPYCACFSDDGDLLAQWCRYTGDGAGVSIGFDTTFFNLQPQPPHPNTLINKAIGLGTIIYNHELQVSLLSEIVKQILSECPKNAYCWLTIQKALTTIAPLFKHSSFFSEQEKRIIYYYTEEYINNHGRDDLSGPYSYKNDEYFRFELSWFRSNEDHAIRKIILGPKCQVSSSEIIAILNRYNVRLNDKLIKRSSSPYI